MNQDAWSIGYRGRMYTAPPIETPKARYKGTVVCPNCHAEYKPGNWHRGYHEGTSSEFTARSKVPDDCCPICNTEIAKDNDD